MRESAPLTQLDDPVICHCLQVTRSRLQQALDTTQAERLTEFFDRTKITTVCTSCRHEVTRAFEEWQKVKPPQGKLRTFLKAVAGLLPSKSRLKRLDMKIRSLSARLAVKPITQRFSKTFFIHDGTFQTILGFARFINPDISQPRQAFQIQVRCFDQGGMKVAEIAFPLHLEEVREIALKEFLPQEFSGSGYVKISVNSGGPSGSFSWLLGTLRPHVTLIRSDGLRATVHAKSKFPKGRLMVLPPFSHDSPFSVELILANTNDRPVKGVLSIENGQENLSTSYELPAYASRREDLTARVHGKPGVWTSYLTADGDLVEYVLIQDRAGSHFAIQHL